MGCFCVHNLYLLVGDKFSYFDSKCFATTCIKVQCILCVFMRNPYHATFYVFRSIEFLFLLWLLDYFLLSISTTYKIQMGISIRLLITWVLLDEFWWTLHYWIFFRGWFFFSCIKYRFMLLICIIMKQNSIIRWTRLQRFIIFRMFF